MTASDPRLVADIKLAEGCKLVAYQDTRGFWTVGYGHLLTNPTDPKWAGYAITQATADAWLSDDLAKAAQLASTLPEHASCDTACRQNALTELVFNIGLTKWEGFHNTRAAIQTKNWKSAHDGLLDSAWASQVGPTRSTRLADYFLTGQYPS